MKTTTFRIPKELYEKVRVYLFNKSLTGEMVSMNKFFCDAIKEKADKEII